MVAPTAHLKVQWAQAAARFALHLDPAWSAADGRLPADMHGIVTTYQQVASSAAVLRRVAADAFVIFDEIHHAADDRAWGDSIRLAFEPSARRLAISGTPFRSDTSAIPFVNYVLDEAAPDFEYGYGDALGDGRVVRPVYFPRTDGADGVDGARRLAQRRPRSTTRSTRPGPASGCAPRCRSRASGCPRCCARRSTRLEPDPRGASPTPAAW